MDESELESENKSEEDEVELSDGSGGDGSSKECIIVQDLLDIEKDSSSPSSSVILFCYSEPSLSCIKMDLDGESSLILVSSISVRSDTI